MHALRFTLALSLAIVVVGHALYDYDLEPRTNANANTYDNIKRSATALANRFRAQFVSVEHAKGIIDTSRDPFSNTWLPTTDESSAQVEARELLSTQARQWVRARQPFTRATAHDQTYELHYGNYSDLIALAFDFYGPQSKTGVICTAATESERRSRVLQVFRDQFWTPTDMPFDFLTYDYWKRVETFIQSTQDAITPLVFSSSSSSLPSTNLLALSNARYASVPEAIIAALWNFDHFFDQGCAWRSWRTIRSLAREKLVAAAQLTSDAERFEAEQEALALSAFGMHLATDQFSSGHMRSPRLSLYGWHIDDDGSKEDDQYYSSTSTPTSFASVANVFSSALAAMQMHDEDGRNGVPVRLVSLRDLFALIDQNLTITPDNLATLESPFQSYMAYGDSFLFDPSSATNRQYANNFVERDLGDLYTFAADGASNKSSNTSLYSDFFSLDSSPDNYYVPIPLDVEYDANDTLASRIPCPYFKWDKNNGTLLTRDPITAVYVRPCTFRAFIPEVDLPGLHTVDETCALLNKPAVQWTDSANAWVATAYASLDCPLWDTNGGAGRVSYARGTLLLATFAVLFSSVVLYLH